MQVSRHIHALKLPFVVPLRPGVDLPRFAYAYLLCGADAIWLIDSGVASSRDAIFDAIRAIGMSPEQIRLLILTHAHPDHIGSARAIQEAVGCPIALHPAEREWAEDVTLQARERPVPGFDVLVGGSVQVGRFLDDGDRLEMGDDLHVEVLHTPGHSPGSISLWVEPDRALITGDAVPLPNDIPIYDDAVATARSVRRLRERAGVEVLLSSWDDPRFGPEIDSSFENSLAYLRRVHEAVCAVADDSTRTDPMELCKRALGKLGLPESVANPLVARTFLAHLAARDRSGLEPD